MPLAIGPLVILAAALGLWLLHRERSWRETLLLAWVVVPLVFFELYPVKGFQYLLLTAPPVAVLAARTLALWSPGPGFGRWRYRLRSTWIGPLAAALIAVSLAVPSWLRIGSDDATSVLAGSGGVPGGRRPASGSTPTCRRARSS